MSTSTLKLTAADLEVAAGKTSVFVTYGPIPNPPVGVCVITIYTATGPRHPVNADIQKSTTTGWVSDGTKLVNNYPLGLTASAYPQITKFTFDCPAPQQFWEIHIQTAPYNPLPNFLDSMIGSCEVRAFQIAFPGLISRMPAAKLIDGTFEEFQPTDEQAKAMAEAKEQLVAGYAIIEPHLKG